MENLKRNNADVPSASRDGLPFSDNIYQHLKYVLEQLSSRLKGQSSLSEDDLEKLLISIQEIRRDSLEGSSNIPLDTALPNPVGYIPEARQQVEKPAGEGSSFTAFKGLKSTWEVPNMEKLSVEEYYKALNARLADVRQQLKVQGGIGDTSLQYINQLSKRNRE